MSIKGMTEWQDVLKSGAEVLWESKLFKIFRMPDGRLWRVMPKWGKAWPFEIVDDEVTTLKKPMTVQRLDDLI